MEHDIMKRHVQDLENAREAQRIRIRNEERLFNAKVMLLIAVFTALLTVTLEQFFK